MRRPLRSLLGARASVALAFLSALPPAFGGEDPRPELELVETTPVETTLGSPDIPETVDVWLEMIGGARESLELAHFYASDEAGSRLSGVVEAIEAAAARGVRVRFLADAGFHATYPETLDRLGARENVALRLYDLRARTGGVLHAKLMLVDGREAFLGSQNFDWRALEHIQELGLRIRVAPLVRAFAQAFEADWKRAAGEEVPAESHDASLFPVEAALAGGAKVRVTPLFSPRPFLADEALWDLPRLVAAIDGARERVLVQLLSYNVSERGGAYFDLLDTALRRAAARGVEVRLLLADWSKRRGSIEALQSLQVLPRVSVRLSTLPQAARGFIPYARVAHSKYLVVDGELAWIGTSNWSRGYFHESRNLGLLIEGEAMATRLEAFFDGLWSSDYCAEIDPCATYEPPRVGG